MRIGVKPGQWGWTFEELVGAWRAAEDAGFDVLSCFDHASSAPDGRAAWDAPALLSAMAGVTSRIRLAVHVLNASLRHPFLVAGQLAVAQAASGGRVEVGIGAGSAYFARFDHEVAGVPFPPFDDRMDGLEASCRVLAALWRGETVTEPRFGLRNASLGPLGIHPPPIHVGGASDRALRIAARVGDGWHAPGREERFGPLCERLDRLCAEMGRPPIAKSVQVRPGDLGLLRERLDRLAAAGASTAVVVLDVDERGPAWVERVAEAVLERR